MQYEILVSTLVEVTGLFNKGNGSGQKQQVTDDCLKV